MPVCKTTVKTDRFNVLRRGFVVLLLLGMSLPGVTLADDMTRCMMELLPQVDGSTTINELRAQCEQKTQTGEVETVADQPSLITERLERDRDNVLQPFSLMAHKPNYILIAAYNASGYGTEHFLPQFDDYDIRLKDTEAQFQISLKTPLALDLFDKFDLYAAYSNRSFWQVYNSEISAPFRETNHEPEAWLQFRPNLEIFGLTNTVNGIGIVHQSNGRGGTLSRSWNRIYANFIAERNGLVMSFKPWYRIKEDSEDDDNEDITDFLGHYELRAGYKYKEHVFTAMSRNNLESGFEKGAVELSWSFPLGNYPYLKGYVQYFNGYGESLIDYNQHVNRVGVGFALTDLM